MDQFRFVRPEHLNHYGHLFGGSMLTWIDEAGWIAASLDFPNEHFVTVAMAEISFERRVEVGEILRFTTTQVHRGTTSVRYEVRVSSTTNDSPICTTPTTLVSVDDDRAKRALPEGA